MKNSPRKPSFPAVLALVLLPALLGTGCVSMVGKPTVEVRAARNSMAPEREQKTYAITCPNELVQQWLVSDRQALLALDAALEKLGYEEASDPALATYLIVAELGFARRPVLEKNENPDSIRFQNVAAMVGQGRYTQLLTERNEGGGSLLIGPTGEIIPTGGWKRVMEDSEPKEVKKMAGTHDSLVLRAWDVAEKDTSGAIPAWEIVVLRTIDYRTPSPEHVGILVRQAVEHLESDWLAENGAEPDSAAVPAGSDETASAAAPTPR